MSFSWSLVESFQFFSIENNVCSWLIIYGIYYAKVGFYSAHFLKSFNHKWVLNFVKAFSTSIKIIIWFLSFNLLIWYITLIDLHILKNPCIPGINPTWSWHMSFLMCCWFCLLKFCWGFLHLSSSVILAYSILFLCYLCLVLISGWWWPCRKSLGLFLPL